MSVPGAGQAGASLGAAGGSGSGAPSNPVGGSGGAPAQTNPAQVLTTALSNKGMPSSSKRDSPRFRNDRPEELRRFLSQMEDLFAQNKVTDDNEKMRYLATFAAADVEEEWTALDTYGAGDYEKFKEEVISNYPEAANAEIGTLRGLYNRIKKYKNIEQDDANEYMSYKRAFMAEVTKLNKQKVPIASNREYVQLFLSHLSDTFHQLIITRLTAKTAAVVTTVGVIAGTARSAEDPFTLEEVIKEGEKLAMYYQSGSFMTQTSSKSATIVPDASGPSSKASTVIKVELEEVKQNVVHIMDRLVNNEKANKQGFEEIKKALAQASESAPSMHSRTQQEYRAPPRPAYNNNQRSDNCYYCLELGHIIGSTLR